MCVCVCVRVCVRVCVCAHAWCVRASLKGAVCSDLCPLLEGQRACLPCLLVGTVKGGRLLLDLPAPTQQLLSLTLRLLQRHLLPLQRHLQEVGAGGEGGRGGGRVEGWEGGGREGRREEAGG